MARKRVSLKDKGPETLGLTDKKGKGIDVLLGGPAATPTRLTSPSIATKSKVSNAEGINMAAENQDTLNNLTGNVPPLPPMPIETLPVNEADADLTLNIQTDELGLPVAMELPPSQLLANVANRAVDDLGLPVALETAPTDLSMAVTPTPPPLEIPVVVSQPDAPSIPVASGDENDLAGLAGQEENTSLTAPVVEPVAAPVVEVAPVVVEASTPLPVAVPPVEFVPPPMDTGVMVDDSAEPLMGKLVAEPAVSAPVETYAPVTAPVAYAPPVPAVPPPPPPPRIESIGGILTEVIPTRVEDLLPADYEYTTGALQVAERARVDRDEALSEKVERYIGAERRKALDDEIVRLYDVVSTELSDNNEDVSFALKALTEAHDIVLEDIRQFDEALYRVALVKTMLVRRQNLRKWSYSWGSFVFFYGIFWLVLFVTAIVFTGNINTAVGTVAGQSGGLAAARSAWYSALAGGIGGIIGILYSLYWRVAVKQNFDRQYMMYYLVQPIMGFFLGAITHLIITVGFLTFNASGVTSEITVILQMVIGFVAGFRQRVVYELIDKIVQKISPDEPDKSPMSVIPEQ
jgi:hypothetical protein